MSDIIKDGGPAFPKLGYLDTPDQRGDRALVYESHGMSQRALLAGMAMHGMYSQEGGGQFDKDAPEIARRAVVAADALLKELNK